MKGAMIRGFMIGSSIGVLASLAGFVAIGDGFVLGGLTGALAGFTVAGRRGR